MDFKSLSDPVVLVGDDESKPGFFHKVRPPSTSFFANKQFLGGVFTVFLLFAVGLGVYLSQQPTELAPRASEPAPQTQYKSTIATDSGEFKNP